MVLLNVSLLVFCLIYSVIGGILYPRPSLKKEVKSLNGLWSFSILDNKSDLEDGTTSNNNTDISLMPVPSSYNDILTSFNGKEHVGCVKYERVLQIPYRWRESRIWLRFESVCYAAEVYLDDTLILSHQVGHLPFETEVSSFFVNETKHKLTVIVNNTLTYTTIPQGNVTTLPSGRETQTVFFDFANFAGIDRSVVIYRYLKNTRVEDITVTTSIQGDTGIVNYQVEVNGNTTVTYNVTVLDKDKNPVGSSNLQNGRIEISNAIFWWPYLMHDDPGYLYTLRVNISRPDGMMLDTYDLPFGIRELTWDSDSFNINGKPVYLRGFGRHEDSDIRGKGLDLPLILRDHNLIRWIGANAYRTTHYPYAEEIMDMADSLGIMIIDEVPAVNTGHYTEELLNNHKKALEEMYQRDKNRPSVVMWSLANEPGTKSNESGVYYKEIVAHMKSFDQTRPVTVVNQVDPDKDHSGQFLDIICFNRYEAWYGTPGDVSNIITNILNKTHYWRALHNKPVVMTEYGADSYPGLHSVPSYIWSEEYQLDLMSAHFEVFDELQEMGWFIGEFIWNFADFQTTQSIKRVGGNRKGVFTRQRQPKASAHFLRQRYWNLAEKLDNAKLPDDLDRYVISSE